MSSRPALQRLPGSALSARFSGLFAYIGLAQTHRSVTAPARHADHSAMKSMVPLDKIRTTTCHKSANCLGSNQTNTSHQCLARERRKAAARDLERHTRFPAPARFAPKASTGSRRCRAERWSRKAISAGKTPARGSRMIDEINSIDTLQRLVPAPADPSANLVGRTTS